jgi:hypothetical protein
MFVCLVACKRDADPGRAPQPSAPSSAVTAATNAGAAADQAPTGPLVLAPTNRIRWAEPPAAMTDVAAVVRDARAREKAEGRSLIVYVGATWCEPCQRFHHAVEHGELDAAFPALTVLAFDADRDSEALATAGYVSRLIPLFALPAPDGRASGQKIEGSVKGEEAVSEITPRLRALIAGAN